MNTRISIIAIAFLILSHSCAASEADGRIGWFQYVGGGHDRTFDVFDLHGIKPFADGRAEYVVSAFTVLPFAFRQADDGRWIGAYNARGLTNAAAILLSGLLSGAGEDDPDALWSSPWTYLLHAHDFRVRLRVGSGLAVFAGTRTDLLPFRSDDIDRSVSWTPHVGLALLKGRLGEWDYSGLSMFAGYRTTWSLEGQGRVGELALSVSLWGPSGI